MPLIIQNTHYKLPFTSNKSVEMIEALKKAPRPAVQEDVRLQLQPRNNELMLIQSEFAYIDRLHPANTIRHVGTLDLATCIFLVMANDYECFVTHLDLNITRSRFNIINWLSRFKDIEKINIHIIGGDWSTQENAVLTNKTLEALFCQLLEAQNYYGNTIELQSQCLKLTNQFTENDKLHYFYDKAIDKADRLKRYLIGKPLRLDRLNDFDSFDFKNRHIEPSSQDRAMLMVFLLDNLAVTGPKSNWHYNNAYHELSKMLAPQKLSDEETFYQTLNKVFSRYGLYAMEQCEFAKDESGDTNMMHFKMDLQAICLTRVSYHQSIPHKSLRYANLLHNGSGGNEPLYEIYDSRRQKIRVPVVSKNLTTSIGRITGDNKTFIDETKMQKLLDHFGLSSDDITSRITIAQIVYNQHYIGLSSHQNTFEESLVINMGIPFSHYYQSKCYYRPQQWGDIAALETLNEHFQLTFSATIRQQFDTVVDAILECDSEQKALQIKNMVQASGLSCYMMRFTNTGPLVCVHELNLAKQADRLQTIRNNQQSNNPRPSAAL